MWAPLAELEALRGGDVPWASPVLLVHWPPLGVALRGLASVAAEA